MDDVMNEIALKVLCDVLEKFAFEFGDPAEPGEMVVPGEASCLARMRFEGPRRGAVALLVDPALGLEIAANVLGLDPDDAAVAKRAPDAIKEILNVVCGNLMTALAGEDEVFDLSVPTMELVGAGVWGEWLAWPETVCVQVDGRPILLQIRIEG